MLNLVTVVGRNTHILPHMIKHYEDLVDKMYIGVYRQDKNDGILEEVLDLGLEPFMVVTDNKYNWEKVTEVYNSIKSTKPNDWWIVTDDDELQIYPYEVDKIIKDCEINNFEFVTGGFLDRIGDNGTFPDVDNGTDLHSAFPYAGYFRHPLSGACPNKVTLMKGSVNVTSGQHYVDFGNGKNSWGSYHPKRMPVQECFTQVHHFKWDSSCVERIKEVADTKEKYTYWWEYKKLYDAIVDNGFTIDITKPEYFVEKMKNFSYIDYNDYPHWDTLTDKIVRI